MFRYTVQCSRPLVPAWSDGHGNTQGTARAAVEFEGVFVPPTTQGGSRIIDGVLRETTVSKPTLFAVGRPDIISGDPIIVDGDDGWQVDGDPAVWDSPWTGRKFPLVIELRKGTG